MPNPLVIDKEMLLDQCGYDCDLLKEIIDLFRNDIQRLIAEIRSAIRSQQADELKDAAHEFRGMASNFGAAATVAAAAWLETAGCHADFISAENACNQLVQEVERLERALSELINHGNNTIG